MPPLVGPTVLRGSTGSPEVSTHAAPLLTWTGRLELATCIAVPGVAGKAFWSFFENYLEQSRKKSKKAQFFREYSKTNPTKFQKRNKIKQIQKFQQFRKQTRCGFGGDGIRERGPGAHLHHVLPAALPGIPHVQCHGEITSAGGVSAHRTRGRGAWDGAVPGPPSDSRALAVQSGALLGPSAPTACVAHGTRATHGPMPPGGHELRMASPPMTPGPVGEGDGEMHRGGGGIGHVPLTCARERGG